jgi:hypothetical protein
VSRHLLVLALLLGVSCVARSGDHDFDSTAKEIEAHYGVCRTHIPLLGMASFFARPWGLSGFKMAVFEDVDISPRSSKKDLESLIESKLSPDWQLFVRDASRRNDETTLIYAGVEQRHARMMIVAVESSEVTLMYMKVSDRAMKKWIEDPGEHVRHGSGHKGPAMGEAPLN